MKDLGVGPLVYILILNWKSAGDTIACVESIQKSDYPNYKILLVDNGSPDESEKVLRDRFPDLAFIQTEKNLGYAGGNNLGIRYAVKNSARYIWILNPDVRVGAQSLSVLIEAMEQDLSMGVCSPRVKYEIASGTVYFDGARYESGRFEAVRNIVSTVNAPVPEVQYVSDVWGCSMLIRKEVFQQIGLIREDFFLYLEETDFNFRAQEYGWKIAVCAKEIVAHLHYRDLTDLDRFYYRRNEMLLARIHKRLMGAAIIWSLALEKVGPYIRAGNYRGALWHLLRTNFQAFLAGWFTPIKPIPRL